MLFRLILLLLEAEKAIRHSDDNGIASIRMKGRGNETLTLPMGLFSVGKSIFACLKEMINDLGYEKNDIHFVYGNKPVHGLLTIRDAG